MPWTNTTHTASQRADFLIDAMTLDEKIAMVHGSRGDYVGNITNNFRLGIPALRLEDGPAGIAAWGPPGITYISPVTLVTAFPTPVAMASTWDTSLMREFATHLATEARGKGVHLINSPMINMVRSPQGGRAYEVFGEDPFLAAELAAAQVQGMQKQGVIANVKSFVNNDQETDRDGGSSDIDERTQREIYFPPFRAAVRAGVGAFMTGYNRVNGVFTSESPVLNAVVKKQWGFDGFVMTDWWAKFSAASAANNGLDLEMPADSHFAEELKSAVFSGAVPQSRVDDMVHRILTIMFRMRIFDDPPTGNLHSNMLSVSRALFARDAAAQGMVLLKNDDQLLPLCTKSLTSIAVIGSAGDISPVSVGGGSATVFLSYEITPLEGITSRAGTSVTVTYEQGDSGRIDEAVDLAQRSDVAIVFAAAETTEGEDRPSLSLPGELDDLISNVAAANSNTVVVLNTGSAVLMPWINEVAAVIEAWYPGQENGNSIAAILFGDINPSGRLPVTFPRNEQQTPLSAPAQFPGANGHVSYSEGILIGYRWYDANGVEPLFPFGHGLSYTTFVYSNLSIGTPSNSGQVNISLDVTNSGGRPGSEVIQLYLGFPEDSETPSKQLKGVHKAAFDAGQSRQIDFTLTQEELSRWSTEKRGWIVPSGTFQVLAGSSSRDIRLIGSFDIPAEIAASDMANTALNRPAVASTMQSSSFHPNHAADGNPTTRWSSAFFSDPQWIYVDLGAVREIGRVKLTWETAFASSYFIQTSNDTTSWTDLFGTTDGDGGIDDLIVNGTGRYLRVYGTQRGTPYGYSLYDIEVFSPPQRPFNEKPVVLPALIEAEDYDRGGEGVAYHDTSSGNASGSYRDDSVDIGHTNSAEEVFWVNSTEDGEWIEYLVSAPDPLTVFRISIRIASTADKGLLQVRLNGAILGKSFIPATGGVDEWQTIVLPDVPVTGGAGTKALRLEILQGGFSIDWIRFERVATCAASAVSYGLAAESSSAQSTNFPPGAAFDGNPLTRWASSPIGDFHWVMLDLGRTQSIARIRLDWESAFARNYQILFSNDNASWTTAFSTTNAVGGINDIALSGEARYVLLYCMEKGTLFGYSLWGMDVFSHLTPPILDLIIDDDGPILQWPAGVPSFRLQCSDSLSPADWKSVAILPEIIGDKNTITVSGNAPTLFFRLKQEP